MDFSGAEGAAKISRGYQALDSSKFLDVCPPYPPPEKISAPDRDIDRLS